jgi:hypothetical protein
LYTKPEIGEMLSQVKAIAEKSVKP